MGGSLPGWRVSGLEDEYRLSAGKPRLIYTKEAARREPRLTTFLEAIRAEGVVSYRHFKDADELGRLVADDLALLLTERFVGPPEAPSGRGLPAKPLSARCASSAWTPASTARPPAARCRPPAPPRRYCRRPDESPPRQCARKHTTGHPHISRDEVRRDQAPTVHARVLTSRPAAQSRWLVATRPHGGRVG